VRGPRDGGLRGYLQSRIPGFISCELVQIGGVANVEHSGGDLRRGGRRHGRSDAGVIGVDRPVLFAVYRLNSSEAMMSDRSRLLRWRRAEYPCGGPRLKPLATPSRPSSRRARPKGDPIAVPAPALGVSRRPRTITPERHGHTANRHLGGDGPISRAPLRSPTLEASRRLSRLPPALG
jgi:hypothetical protein